MARIPLSFPHTSPLHSTLPHRHSRLRGNDGFLDSLLLEESINVSLTIAGNLLPARKCLSPTPSNPTIIFLSLSPCLAIAVSNLLVQAVFTVALADCRSKLLVEHIDGLRQACQKVQKAKKVFGKGAAGSIRYATMLIGKIMWIASISIQSNTAWYSKRRCGHIPVFIAMWQKDCCILNGAWPRNWLGILASAPCSVGGRSPTLRFWVSNAVECAFVV